MLREQSVINQSYTEIIIILSSVARYPRQALSSQFPDSATKSASSLRAVSRPVLSWAGLSLQCPHPGSLHESVRLYVLTAAWRFCTAPFTCLHINSFLCLEQFHDCIGLFIVLQGRNLSFSFGLHITLAWRKASKDLWFFWHIPATDGRCASL